MKMVQSCWSCNQAHLLRFNAGWYAPEYHLMGWALSCLQLTKYYDNVVLHADSNISKILIDTLQLPYTDVVCDLDSINSYNPQLWALPKIHTYSQQNTPFLHIDGDVFIWKPFDEQLLKGELIAQNLEIATAYYEGMLENLESGLKYFPTEIIAEREKSKQVYAYNAGILGGTDIGFLNLYSAKAKEFISKNAVDFSKINVAAFNIFFEQYLFYCCVQKDKKNVSLLLKEVIPDNGYIGFGDFMEVPHNKQYLHLIGHYKRNRMICEQMANRLRQDYPDYYYRIIALFKNKKIPLKKDYYYFIDKPDEENLTTRYSLLKATYKNNELLVRGENNNTRSRELSFRIKLVEEFISDKLSVSTIQNKLNYTTQLNDLNNFEDQLALIGTKFEIYSNDYLYGRDLTYIQYFQFVFEEKSSIDNKVIVADPIVEIVESEFDWSETFPENINIEKLIVQLNAQSSIFYTAVVPECDVRGYSLINIDDLDRVLLEITQKPLTINEVLNEAKSSFASADLEDSSTEFELLITGRIKMALENKLIKAVM
jgi:hypothetical protein